MNNREIRSFNIRSVENSRTISGYSIVFNEMSVDLGGFREIISPTAINDELISRSDIVMNYSHDDNLILARSQNGNGTLHLRIDEHGLFFEFDMPNSALGEQVLESIRRGDISTCSFAFTLPDNDTCETWEKREDGTIVRTIMEIGGLYDCAIVCHAAYPSTSVSARSLEMINKLNNDNMTEENKTLRNDENPNEDEEKKEETQNEETQEEQKGIDCEDDEENRSEDENENQEENTSDENTDDENDETNKTSDDEKTEEKENKNINKQISMEKKNFSLLRAIRNVVDNQKFDEVTQAMVNEARSEMTKSGLTYSGQIQLPVTESRATISVTAEHGDLIETTVENILAPLQDNLVLVNAGANYLNGLINDVQIPTMTAENVGWVGEISSASDGAGSFDHITLSPKRLSAYIDVSRQLLIQDSVGAENMIRTQLVAAIGQKLEETILGTAAGTTTKPAGIGYGLTATEISDFKGICGVEAELEDANLWGGYHYIVSPSTKSSLRSMIKGTNATGMVMENGEIDGTPAEVTNHVADNCYYVGDFSQLYIGQWGSVDLVVDNVTKAVDGQVRLVINAYFDAKLVRSGAIALGEIVEPEAEGNGAG